LPEQNEESLAFVERHIQRAVSTSRVFPMGPVHINVPFREPLLLDMEQTTSNVNMQVSEIGKLVPSEEFLEWYRDILQNEERGLFIVGDSLQTTDGFWEFAKLVQWPVLVDPLSNLRASIPAECMDL